MADDPINLNEIRAQRDGDSTKWTVVDCLKAMLRDIEKGDIAPDKVVIHWTQTRPDGSWKHGAFCAGVTFCEHISILANAQYGTIQDWRGES